MNAKVICCLFVLAAGVQSAVLPSSLPADSELQNVPTRNISGWIERITLKLQHSITSAFLEWIDSLNAIESIALEQLGSTDNVPTNRDTGACVKEHIERSAAIVQAGVQDLAQCTHTAIGQAVDLRESLVERLNAIKAEGAKIVNVVRDCRENQPDNVRQCIADNGQVIVDAVKAIATETVELLVQAKAQWAVIVELNRDCVGAVLERVAEEHADSQLVLSECLKEALNP